MYFLVEALQTIVFDFFLAESKHNLGYTYFIGVLMFGQGNLQAFNKYLTVVEGASQIPNSFGPSKTSLFEI